MSDAIPEFGKTSAGQAALSPVPLGGGGRRTLGEIAVIVLVAVVVIGTMEFLLGWYQVPEYVMPKPSAIGAAFVKELPLILPHWGYTLVTLAPNGCWTWPVWTPHRCSWTCAPPPPPSAAATSC